MDWWIIALAIAVMWFPAGYLGARLINALQTERFYDDSGTVTDERLSWRWGRQITKSNKVLFGLGVIFAYATLVFALGFILLMLIVEAALRIAGFFGKLAP